MFHARRDEQREDDADPEPPRSGGWTNQPPEALVVRMQERNSIRLEERPGRQPPSIASGPSAATARARSDRRRVATRSVISCVLISTSPGVQEHRHGARGQLGVAAG